jgi:hypothetical protein
LGRATTLLVQQLKGGAEFTRTDRPMRGQTHPNRYLELRLTYTNVLEQPQFNAALRERSIPLGSADSAARRLMWAAIREAARQYGRGYMTPAPAQNSETTIQVSWLTSLASDLETVRAEDVDAAVRELLIGADHNAIDFDRAVRDGRLASQTAGAYVTAMTSVAAVRRHV